MFQDEQVPNLNVEPQVSQPEPKDTKLHHFAGVEISKLSKTQMKRYQRLQKWLQEKRERRAKERKITKNRKLDAKLQNVDLGPSIKTLKSNKMCESPCKITVAVDLSFDDLMIPKVKSHAAPPTLVNNVFLSGRI